MSSDFGLKGPKAPVVCPSDRQLALRAKLKTGWSVKTNQFSQYPKPPPLTEKEQQAIVAVIKKAEELDLNEQYRVGKLVDRLESLRRLANGNGITQCVLCGDSFGLSVFGRNSYSCSDCKKGVCRKCVVDFATTGSTSGSSSPKESVLRLCKLCSENREFIKKSGAWFFKGVPKYVLPEKTSQYNNSFENLSPASSSYREQKYMSRYISGAHVAALASGTGNRKRAGGVFWTKNLPNRSQSEHECESSSGDETIGLAGKASKIKGTTVTIPETTSSPSPGAVTSVVTTTVVTPTPASTTTTTMTSTIGPTVSEKSKEKKSILNRFTSDGKGRSKSDEIVTQEDHVVEIAGPTLMSTGGISKLYHKSVDRFDPSDQPLIYSDNNARSLHNTSSSDVGHNFNSVCVSNNVASSSSSSSSSQRSHSVQSTDVGLGYIEASILYDDTHQALHCSIHRAKDLMPTDLNGLSDPFCMLKLVPTRFEGTHLRTKVVHKTLQPVFNETLTFYGVTQNDMARQALQLNVLDDDRWGRDCLGSAQISLHRIKPQQTRFFTLSLEKQLAKNEEKEWGRGRLLLSLSYVTEKSLLLVGIIRAEGLPALDHNGTSDPFVKVKLIHDSNMGSLSSSSILAHRKFKTSVKWKTLNPEFREEFSLNGLAIEDLPKLALAIAVFDRDLGNNYLGGILLSATSKGERLKHWTEMIQHVNVKHVKWHTLSPALLPQ